MPRAPMSIGVPVRRGGCMDGVAGPLAGRRGVAVLLLEESSEALEEPLSWGVGRDSTFLPVVAACNNLYAVVFLHHLTGCLKMNLHFRMMI